MDRLAFIGCCVMVMAVTGGVPDGCTAPRPNEEKSVKAPDDHRTNEGAQGRRNATDQTAQKVEAPTIGDRIP